MYEEFEASKETVSFVDFVYNLCISILAVMYSILYRRKFLYTLSIMSKDVVKIFSTV